MGTARPYRGPSGKIVGESPWFCYADIPDGGDFLVVIEDVLERKGVRFADGKANDVEMSLRFVGIEKELRVNVSHRRVLDDLYTPQTGEWVGKPILLYVQQGIKVGKDIRSGVRIRNRKTEMPANGRAPIVRAAQAAPAPAASSAPLATDAQRASIKHLLGQIEAAAMKAGLLDASAPNPMAATLVYLKRQKGLDMAPTFAAQRAGTLALDVADAVHGRLIVILSDLLPGDQEAQARVAETVAANQGKSEAEFDGDLPF